MSTHVDPIALEASSGSARRAMLAHLDRCPDCRSAASEHDPTILFGLLALEPMPESLLSDLSDDVARLAGRDKFTPFASSRYAASPRRVAAAAAVVLAVLCGYTMLHEPPAAPPTISMARPRADVAVDSGRGVSQVIDLTVGETQIVMVYNRDLKL